MTSVGPSPAATGSVAAAPVAGAPTTLVIFGASGDLAARLLAPALYRLEQLHRLDNVRLVGAALESWTDDQFRTHLNEKLTAQLGDEGGAGGLDRAALDRFLARWTYRTNDLTPESTGHLGSLLSEVNIFYLALPPGLFPKAANAIAESGIVVAGMNRLVVEKPFGTDVSSAAALEDELHRNWPEDRIFRIDHFLGKETVQNLSVLRFANRVFEPLLCAAHVDQVQITAAETLGLEGRYRYYDGIGCLRDMIQNHLMQLFCLAAMEPPAVWDAEILRDHKVEVLQSVRRSRADVATWAGRGQYGAGSVGGQAVPAYRTEEGIGPDSRTETFAAVRLEVDTWRWQGVPFYLRSGKRLGAKVSEIAFRFREPPSRLFDDTTMEEPDPNWLIFRLDSPEGIDLVVQTKQPGLDMIAEPSRLHADYGTTKETVTAYQQLLLDVLEGDHTPFLRVDEIDWAWRILDPVLKAWQTGEPDLYPAGSDGPASQQAILLPGHHWRPLPA